MSTAQQETPGRSWSGDPYAKALRTGRGPLFLRRDDGWLLPLEVERWCARADAVDQEVLRRCEGAVLDVGCGPGRLVVELAALGRPVLGIDVSEAAVAHTVGLGGQALRRSVFAPLPGEGRWGTALLLDGNLGIGGDPRALLRRLGELLLPGGLLIAETVPADVDERVEVRLVGAAGGSSPVGAHETADSSGLSSPHETAGGSGPGSPHETADSSGPGSPHETADSSGPGSPHETADSSGPGNPHETADRSGPGNPHETAGSSGAGDAPFPWARLGTPALLRCARPLGWRAAGQWTAGGRSFVALRSRRASSSAEPPKSRAVISSQRGRKPSAESAVADA
ncbi:methyltransferase domain-containing protein [Streptomyces sp. CA-210063]|uniref:class I SAM-dependent methyltransferase n=1 Tax=Streptomyces sp. CA-210063 TaxID=2801029 RepID=UPI00214C9880|nr:class I SAM-dependent methyltransferase [Streptomyces sp. CA-210063]UUU29937.1 methyltransferase domain-containing protein [Streptomyces sp. CA-210063]